MRITFPRVVATLALALAVSARNERRDASGDVAAGDVPAVDPTGRPDAVEGTTDSTVAAAGQDAAADAAAVASAPAERAALGVLNAINDHEIAAGGQAFAKQVEGEVADYARMMIDPHSENRRQTTALGADAAAEKAQAQQQKGQAELARLDAMTGDAYAQAYVAAMVKGHTEALATLDGELIPAATTPAVRDHLTRTREHVAANLERAKALASAR